MSTPLCVALIGDSWATSTALTEGLRNALPSGSSVRSRGVSGARAERIFVALSSGYFNEALAGVSVVVLSCAINNAISGRGPGPWLNTVFDLCMAIGRRGAVPVILPLPPVTVPLRDSHRALTLVRRVRCALVHRGADAVSRYNDKLRGTTLPCRGRVAPDFSIPLGDWSPDQVHLSPEGYRRFAAALGAFLVHGS